LRISEPLSVCGVLGLPNTTRNVQRRLRLPAIRPPNRGHLISQERSWSLASWNSRFEENSLTTRRLRG
jgi:hypothetical protein